MSEKRFVAEQVDVVNEDETEVWDIVFDTENTYAFMVRDTDTASGLCDLLNQLYQENGHLIIGNKNLMKKNEQLKEENERLRNQLERKTILLKIRTKHIDDRVKSFHELLTYLESFCYKSNIDGNYAKQDIINILNNWEIREYD